MILRRCFGLPPKITMQCTWHVAQHMDMHVHMSRICTCIRARVLWRAGLLRKCHNTSRFSLGTTDALPLSAFNVSIPAVQAYMLRYARPRCRYKSFSEVLNGTRYGRAALRARSSIDSCDNWAFKAGDFVTVVAWNHLSAPDFLQHSRWFPIAALRAAWRP